jgi:1,2-diacylglycerol 3-alpha-glucosyltransferase
MTESSAIRQDLEKPMRVALLCSGFGRVRRGYETFVEECSRELGKRPEVQLSIFKGGGHSDRNEVRIPTTPRDGRVASSVARLARTSPYLVEQVTFTLAAIPSLRRLGPDVVWCQDWVVSRLLSRLRRPVGPFGLLWTNGGPDPPPHRQADIAHQISPMLYETALESGEPADRNVMLPLASPIAATLDLLGKDDRAALRRRLEIPPDRAMLLCVAAINSSHKRIDYLIEEVAAMSPQPYLVMLGARDGESPPLESLAHERLGRGHMVRTVSSGELPDYHRAADAFVLPSLREGMPRALIEAMGAGLPCAAHDYDITRWPLADLGHFGDFRERGGLASAAGRALAVADDPIKRHAIHARAFERFSWDRLTDSYVDMIRAAEAVRAHGRRSSIVFDR